MVVVHRTNYDTDAAMAPDLQNHRALATLMLKYITCRLIERLLWLITASSWPAAAVIIPIS